MPELPEVETVRRGLERQLTAFEIERVEVLRQRAIAAPEDVDQFRAGLIGCLVGSLEPPGEVPDG